VKAVCQTCSKLKNGVHKNRSSGKLQCRKCYQREHTETCCRCGRERPIITRDPNGGAVCGACYNKTYTPPQEPCCRCGRERPIATRDPDGGAVCNACYQRERRARRKKIADANG